MKNLTIAGIRIVLFLLFPYWVALFVGTHIPNPELPDIDNIDKFLHATAYAGLSFLLVWAIPRRTAKSAVRYLLAGIVAIAYASIDELTQIPVGRTADWDDWYADLFGIAIGLASFAVARKIYKVIRHRRQNRLASVTTV